ncbi:unnamed protein product [Leptidea sinapis]|uniref:Uncharacterized protein n=1 Tax=Leptidea sinapis TaxID=189913 RepID=A0A5E4PWR3_9NEOP|nr:unnamed protein product [Leptidea sinapis]
MLNVGLVLWCTLLLLFHLRNTLTGLTAREYKQKRKLNLTTLKENLRSVFGARWYFAIFWPLLSDLNNNRMTEVLKNIEDNVATLAESLWCVLWDWMWLLCNNSIVHRLYKRRPSHRAII